MRYDDPEVREFKLNAERNNGRSGPGGQLVAGKGEGVQMCTTAQSTEIDTDHWKQSFVPAGLR